MERFYVFLIENRIGIYIFCGLGLFWFGSNLIRARGVLRSAVFSIEREQATRIQNRALIIIFVLFALVGMATYVNAAIRPTLAPELLVPPTFTPDIFATPLSSPTPLITPLSIEATVPPLAATATLPPDILPAAGSSAQTRPPQATQPPSANGTIPVTAEESAGGNGAAATSTPSSETLLGCGPTLNISNPVDGDTLSGQVTILGTASGDDFFFYKLEINGPETGGVWASLTGAVAQQPVDSGTLGSVNLGAWAEGAYTIRLTVVDRTSNEVGSCAVAVTVVSSQ